MEIDGLIIVNNSTKLCLVSMDDSWKKKRGNGVRYTRFAFSFFLSPSLDTIPDLLDL
jgi:hypothetical protein